MCYAPAAAMAPMAPTTKIRIIRPINEITSPAIAKPLGFLVIPTPDRINPKAHNIQPKTGIYPKNKPNKAKTNPAIPIPLLLFSAC